MVPMRFLAVCLAVLTFACGETPSGVDSAGVPPRTEDPIVVLFMVDGIDSNTVLTAVDNGAETVAGLLQHTPVTPSRPPAKSSA